MAVRYHESRVTPDFITKEWLDNKKRELSAINGNITTIYPVIGTNLEFNQKIGAARNVRNLGVPSIGIPVYSIKQRRALYISEIEPHVRNAYKDLRRSEHLNKRKNAVNTFYFAVTKIGIKTHDINDIARLFIDFTEYDNVFLPREFWEILYW